MNQSMSVGKSLVDFLATCRDSPVTFASEELEGILGQQLPVSARGYGHWWHDWQHWHVRRWQALGSTVHCSLAAELVTFTRVAGRRSSAPAGRSTRSG